MSATVLVTGATGLTGANVCKQLIERGDGVRALARATADTAPLAALGAEIVTGDVSSESDVRRAAEGCESAVHCAALLGGASQDMDEFRAVNVDGTNNVLDAAASLGLRRVVAVSTTTFFDKVDGVDREEAPLSTDPGDDPYTVTKMEAFVETMRRAAGGMDVVSTHPGAIYGPSPVVGNALGTTSFNRVLLAALRGRIERYLTFPVSWVLADDVARGCILALDEGVPGERYMLDGLPGDVVTTAEACNRICEIAGVQHRVEDVRPSDDPELARVFGPTLVAISEKAETQIVGRLAHENSKTYKRLGYVPSSLDAGLRTTYEWFRDIGRFA